MFIFSQTHFGRSVDCVQQWALSAATCEFLRRSQSVQAWHCEIHNDQVRAQFRGLWDRFFSVDDLATNLPIRIGFQGRPKPSQHRFVVIGNWDSFATDGLEDRPRVGGFLKERTRKGHFDTGTNALVLTPN